MTDCGKTWRKFDMWRAVTGAKINPECPPAIAQQEPKGGLPEIRHEADGISEPHQCPPIARKIPNDVTQKKKHLSFVTGTMLWPKRFCVNFKMRDKDRKCKIREGSPATSREVDCLQDACTFLKRMLKRIHAMGPLRKEDILGAVHITSSKMKESDWSDLLIVGGGRKIQTRTFHVRAGAVIEIWIYLVSKLQLLYVSSLTTTCMSAPVEWSDNKRWFCAAEDTQQIWKWRLGRRQRRCDSNIASASMTGRSSRCHEEHVELDEGQPFGSMKEVLSGDIKKYAKDLDPTMGW